MKTLLLMTAVATIGTGHAIAHHESGGQHAKQGPPPSSVIGQKTGRGTGLIERIDREKGAVTIKHGPLQGLNMPAMTMSFLVKDKAMLSSLQPLQKVDFELTYDGKRYLITGIK